MKMAGLGWMVVVLAFFLSPPNSLAAVDQTWLTSIVDGIKNEYALGDTFSLAVNIPQNQDPNSLKQVLQADPADKVKETVAKGQVYQGTRVVAATQTDAVSRVLENLQPLIQSSKENVLIIYSEGSPDANGIATKINDVTQNWSSYVFAFSKVADVPDADTSQLSQTFKQLDISKLGLDNIFRCYKPGDDAFQCTSCSSGGDVTPSCITNTSPSETSTSAPGTGIHTGVGTGEGNAEGTGTGAGVGAGVGTGVATAEGTGTGASEGTGTGAGVGAGVVAGAGIGTAIGAGRRRRRKEKAGRLRKCRGRRRRGCRRGRGGKRGKGGKVGKWRKRKRGRKGRKRGKLRRGRKGKKRGKRRRGGKRRKGGWRRKGGKRRKGGWRKKGGWRRKGGKRRRGGWRRGKRWG